MGKGTPPAETGKQSSDATEAAKFGFSAEQLTAVHKNLATFLAYGGLQRLLEALRTDRYRGVDESETTVSQSTSISPSRHRSVAAATLERIETNLSPHSEKEARFKDRRRAFLDNRLPTARRPRFLQLLWATYNDPILVLLTAAAAVSLAVGLYQSFGTEHNPKTPSVEWVEGVAILVAIVIIVLAGSINDWEKQRQFRQLERKQAEREVKVIRSGVSQLIGISDVVVGDVVRLEPGDVVPADGILISGHNVSCDESTTTGESDLVHKRTGDEVYRELVASSVPPNAENPGQDPFLSSGTSVLEGIGTYLVTATGVNSSYGKILASTQDAGEPTPLQDRLSVLAKYIARLGAVLAILLFIVLFIRFLVSLPKSSQTPSAKGQAFIDILIITLTVLVIAVPEGLPIVLTLSLAFATTRMLKDNNLVRRLQACETMGNATSICSDKTGTLTEGNMIVREAIVGSALELYSLNRTEKNASEKLASEMAPNVKDLLLQSIALNSTAFEAKDGQSFIGSKTECALLSFAQAYLGMRQVDIERSSETIVQVISFSGVRQCMATVIKLKEEEPGYRLFVKGAAEMILDKSTRILREPAQSSSGFIMNDQERRSLESTVSRLASQSLRTLSFGFKDFHLDSSSDDCLPDGATEFSLEYLLQDLVFLSVVGIEDPLRLGVPDAIMASQKAGVTVRMVTGDNMQTAKAIAKQCGILNNDEDNIAMEGAEFRQLSEAEMISLIPHLKVIARSSPADKQTLVVRLRSMGEIVAVTGDGTNDASAMSAADVSFSMGGISGTEVAREASSIVLLNDDFMSIVKAIMWGRAVNDSVKKFLQFQITITVTSVVLTFISAIASSTENSILTPVQLMWVNLVQDTMAALALATDPPQPDVLNRKPEPREAPLVTMTMWKTILVQSIWQLAVTLVLYFAGNKILSHENDPSGQQLDTLIFNVYVWLQIFNLLNNRQHDNNLNVFSGIFQNWIFLSVITIMMGVQILIIFVGGSAFSVVPLNGPQWAISIVLGLLSLLVGVLTRMIPDWPMQKTMHAIGGLWAAFKSRFSRAPASPEQRSAQEA